MRTRALLLLLLILSCNGCRSRITPDRLRELSPGMPLADVVRRFGQPDRIEQTETTGLRGAVYHYSDPQGDARVILINDHVFRTEYGHTAASPEDNPSGS